MLRVSDIIRELECNGFYGSLEVKFEAGRVVLVRKTETIKPTNNGDSRDNRGQHEPPT